MAVEADRVRLVVVVPAGAGQGGAQAGQDPVDRRRPCWVVLDMRLTEPGFSPRG